MKKDNNKTENTKKNNNNKKASLTREIVLDLLLEADSADRGKKAVRTDRLIRDVLDKYDYLDTRDKAFIRRLANDCIEKRMMLDHVIDNFSKVKTSKMKPAIRCIMRMGCDQILFMESVPSSAACNEAVLLAGKKGFHGLKGFVNGVLRTIDRNREDIKWPDKEKSPVEFLAVRYSVPEWIAGLFLKSFGSERAERILASYLMERPVSVRYLTTEGNREAEEKWLSEVKAAGISVATNPYYIHAYDLTGVDGVAKIPGYEEGMFAVQDISSMLAVLCAGISEGDMVVDVCAAPGGKSCFAAEIAHKGKVLSFDLSDAKVDLIKENAKRLKLGNLKAEVHDALEYDSSLEGIADVVICDLPCSGLGVIGRKPDIKFRVKPEDITALAELQRRILTNAARYVRSGGRLIFSTCTVSEEENDQNRKWILDNKELLHLKKAPLGKGLPESLNDMAGDGKSYVRFLTGEPDGAPLMDGFFVAAFEKE
ncbi:MAG: 16S rRNA (cytosine(967)-C(5))-methyltransferase RsmB [Lachnospiraceae bacterium]|nr:16S rRNA (cytosine(967)-C(5))-methyltransferase RsmB [Lachnospiraceae bacterium]